MPSPEEQHRTAVTKQDDEARRGDEAERGDEARQDHEWLQEDVVERDAAQGDGQEAGGALPRQSAAEVDRQSVGSFPASDAPSSWAGPPDGPDADDR